MNFIEYAGLLSYSSVNRCRLTFGLTVVLAIQLEARVT